MHDLERKQMKENNLNKLNINCAFGKHNWTGEYTWGGKEHRECFMCGEIHQESEGFESWNVHTTGKYPNWKEIVLRRIKYFFRKTRRTIIKHSKKYTI